VVDFFVDFVVLVDVVVILLSRLGLGVELVFL
jgi:hypothetical protein